MFLFPIGFFYACFMVARCRPIAVNRQIFADLRAVIVEDAFCAVECNIRISHQPLFVAIAEHFIKGIKKYRLWRRRREAGRLDGFGAFRHALAAQMGQFCVKGGVSRVKGRCRGWKNVVQSSCKGGSVAMELRIAIVEDQKFEAQRLERLLRQAWGILSSATCTRTATHFCTEPPPGRMRWCFWISAWRARTASGQP